MDFINSWFQGLATSLVVLIGLAGPAPNLKLDCEALRSPDSIDVQGVLNGAVTSQVKDYLMAGNSLTIVVDFRWGTAMLEETSTIEYHAWSDDFAVSQNTPNSTVVTKDVSKAFLAWETIPRRSLGTLEELEANLGKPLMIKAELKPGPGTPPPGNIEALWSYKKPQDSLLYETWLEIPQ